MTGTLSIAEAAEVLGIGRRTAYDLLERQAGELAPGVTAFKVGSVWKVSRFALAAALGMTIEELAS